MNLTIIFSSRHPDSQFVHHLKRTCGLKVEILAYTNPGKKSLSEVYNHGLSQARHDFIVFVHDDVIFERRHWGSKIVQHLQRSAFGILGIAGTTHLSSSGIWWQDPLKTLGRIKHQKSSKTWLSNFSGDFKERIIPAVCVDGVFMAVNRNRLQEHFNPNLTGFHFYDIDFCLNNYLKGVKIGVIFNVPLIHKSIGQPNEAWESHRSQFIATHQYNLPCTLKSALIVNRQPLQLKRYPKISIIIPHHSKNWLLFNCLNALAEQSTYPNYEIIIADTGSSPTALAEIENLVNTSTLNLKVVTFDQYHFGHVNNTVVFNHTDSESELLLFCNNDIELINDALTRMVQVYLQHSDHCGTIGCRLHFADNTIQHAGIQLLNQPDQSLKISHKGWRSDYYFNADGLEADILGSTAAFLLMPRALFEQIGGFNLNYQRCLEDVELNLTCIIHQKVNYLVNEAVCYHFESQTRLEQGRITKHDYETLLKFVQENDLQVGKYIDS